MELKTRTKFIITVVLTVTYITIDILLCRNWFADISLVFGKFVAGFTISGISIFPAILCSVMLMGVIFDKEREYEIPDELPDITILVAARNEEDNIYGTLKSISENEYRGNITVKVIDNNSEDLTAYQIMRGKEDFTNITIDYMLETHKGKSYALNAALPEVETEYFVTLDADTELPKNSLNRLVTAMVEKSKSDNVSGVAGSCIAKNHKDSFMTRLQYWDYFLSISSVKRYQGYLGGGGNTLVLQGAYSIYNTQAIREIGGWDTNSIGEDITLTWDLLFKGYRTSYEPKAISYTKVPTTYKSLFHQRSRWAKCLPHELIKRNVLKYPTIYTTFFISMDYLLFVIDIDVVCVLLPSVFAALLFHNYLFVGKMTLLCLPLTLIMFAILYHKEKKTFESIGEKIKESRWSLIPFALMYQFLVAPASLVGYVKGIFHMNHSWK